MNNQQEIDSLDKQFVDQAGLEAEVIQGIQESRPGAERALGRKLSLQEVYDLEVSGQEEEEVSSPSERMSQAAGTGLMLHDDPALLKEFGDPLASARRK